MYNFFALEFCPYTWAPSECILGAISCPIRHGSSYATQNVGDKQSTSSTITSMLKAAMNKQLSKEIPNIPQLALRLEIGVEGAFA